MAITMNDFYTNPMMGLGMQLLANSGPSMTPTSLGQRMGNAGLGFIQQQIFLRQAESEQKLQEKYMKRIDEQLKIIEKQMKLSEKEEKLRERAGNLIGELTPVQGDAFMPGAPPDYAGTGTQLMGIGAQLSDPNMMRIGIGMQPSEIRQRGLGGGNTLLYETGPFGGETYRGVARRDKSLLEQLQESEDLRRYLLERQQGEEAPPEEEKGPGFFARLFGGGEETPRQVNPTQEARDRFDSSYRYMLTRGGTMDTERRQRMENWIQMNLHLLTPDQRRIYEQWKSRMGGR